MRRAATVTARRAPGSDHRGSAATSRSTPPWPTPSAVPAWTGATGPTAEAAAAWWSVAGDRAARRDQLAGKLPCAAELLLPLPRSLRGGTAPAGPPVHPGQRAHVAGLDPHR